MEKLPITLRLGAPTGIRPAGAHKNAKRVSRAAVKRELRKGDQE